MNLRDLEYLVALADHHGFRQAALACEVSQPSLSTSVRKLEAELGGDLVDRSLAHAALTPLGLRVVERARLVLDDVAAIRALGRQDTSPESGTVRLGLFPTLGPYLLPRVLPRIRLDFPRIHLLLSEEKSADLLDGLIHGRLDAAALALPIEDPRLHVQPLFEEEFLLAVPAGHSLARAGVAVEPGELDGHALLLLAEGHCLAEQVSRWVAAHGATLREDYRATSLETLRHMVASGAGPTLLPAMAVLPPVADNPGIVLRRFAANAPHRTIALVWRRSAPLAEAVAALAAGLVPADDPDGLVRRVR